MAESDPIMNLYSYKEGEWTKLGNVTSGYDHRIVEYNGEIFVAYNDSSYKLNLVKYTDGTANEIYSSPTTVNSYDIYADESGVYLSYEYSDSVYAVRYNGAVSSLGSYVCSNLKYPANSQIEAAGGKVYLAFSDVFDSSKVYLCQYNETNNNWNIVDNTLTSKVVAIKADEENIYLAINQNTSDSSSLTGEYISNIYKYDMNNNGVRTVLGSDSFCSNSILSMEMTIDRGTPYVFYCQALTGSNMTYVSTYVEGKASKVCNKVSSTMADSMSIEVYNSKLYINYRDSVMEKMYTKYTELEKEQENIDEARITGHSLYLNGKIGVRFYMHIPTEIQARGYVVSIDGQEVNTIYDAERGQTFCGVEKLPAHMNQKVMLEVKDSEGEVILTDNYSALDYVDEVVEHEGDGTYSEELTTLVKAMASYGYTVAEYFVPEDEREFPDSYYIDGDNADGNSADDNICIEELQQYKTVVKKVTEQGACNLNYIGESLRMMSGTDLRYYFSRKEDVDMDKLSVVATDESGRNVDVAVKEKAGIVYFEISSISVALLGEKYTLDVGYDGESVYEICGSVYGYVAKVLEDESKDEKLRKVCKALYRFGKVAEQYINFSTL